jgi:putative transposase
LVPRPQPSLTALSDAERSIALGRYNIILPYLADDVPFAKIAQRAGISDETARNWVKNYRRRGLAGLARKRRKDRSQRRISSKLQHIIEGLALTKPRLSVAAVYRAAIPIADKLGEKAPSYGFVYGLIRDLNPGMCALAHEGSKSYSETYDLVHRAEAEAPNAIWQADHSVLDIMIDDCGTAKKPWLTIMLDDYSRAVAGYSVSFSAPSAIQTALALRQGMWRKSKAGWNVCGIPDVGRNGFAEWR